MKMRWWTNDRAFSGKRLSTVVDGPRKDVDEKTDLTSTESRVCVTISLASLSYW